MKILVIDDALVDFTMLRLSLRLLPVEPWIETVELTHSMCQLIDPLHYREYGGVIVDLHLPGKSGVSVAADIANVTQFTTPVLLATAEDKENIPWAVRAFVDGVAFKADRGSRDEDSLYLWTLRAFLRNCWRLDCARRAPPPV